MKNRLLNFFILADIFIACYLAAVFFLSFLFPAVDGPGISGLFIMGAPVPLILIFLVTLFALRHTSLNKNDNPLISVVSIVLFFGSLFFIFFSFGVDIGAYPLSRVTKSKLVCNMILSDSAKERCLVNISMLTGDDSSCPSIEDSEKKYQCFWRVAEKTLDITLCDEAGRYKDMCVIAVAKGTGNKQYCELMPTDSTFSKEYCIGSVK
ncbi:MAG: hypothetical protein Q7R79_04540 [bacterium]|nr:hypothetical protein [bacterium]